jgi:CheY-like chemotaxis protein
LRVSIEATIADQVLVTARAEGNRALADSLLVEVNNLLTPLILGMELLRLDATNPRVSRLLGTLDATAHRAAERLKQILPIPRRAANETPELEPELAREPRGNGETILLVDNENAILELTAELLALHGYRVLTAQDGAVALRMFARHRTEIRAVIADLVMPLMDGPTTIRALRRMDPGVRVLAASGLELAVGRAGLKGLGVASVIEKPYSARRLLRALHQLIVEG